MWFLREDRGELDDKLEGPKYTARRAELRREAGEAARARDRQAAAASQDEAQSRRGERRDRQRMKRQTVASWRENDERSGTTARRHEGRIGDRLQREIVEEADAHKGQGARVGGRRLATHTPLLKIPVCCLGGEIFSNTFNTKQL